VFVRDQPLEPSLMFVGNARAYVLYSRVGPWRYLQTLD